MKKLKIMKSLLFVALLASMLGGCIKYSDGKPVETTEAADIKETSKPSENKGKEKKPKDEDETQKGSEDKQETDDLQTYLDENFFMTSWYELIEEVTVSQNKVTIKTSVFGDDEGKESVEGLVSSIWRFTNANDSAYDFSQITILDKEERAIISEQNPLQ